jgi:ketosteroid isomerase-like protein
MRKRLLPMFLAVACGSIAALALQRPDHDADRAGIRAHVDRIFKGYIDKNRQTVLETHTNDWRGFLSGSRSVIKGIDEYMKNADALLESPFRLYGYQMLEFDVQFYGDDFAVINYVASLEQGPPDGPRRTSKLRVLDVYVRRGGHWIQAASNTGPHPDTIAAARHTLFVPGDKVRAELLKARRAVWDAWFGGDTAALLKLLPPETIALSPGDWHHRDEIVRSSEAFARSGAKLVRLDFPKTEIQAYGDVFLFYTSYVFETDEVGAG